MRQGHALDRTPGCWCRCGTPVDRGELFRNCPDPEEEDVRQALEFAAANLADEGAEMAAA